MNAAKPAGEWQTLDVVWKSPRFDAKGEKTANAMIVKATLNGAGDPRERGGEDADGRELDEEGDRDRLVHAPDRPRPDRVPKREAFEPAK